jgi:hypothetical protein
MRHPWQLGAALAVVAVFIGSSSITADNQDDLAIIRSCEETLAGGLPQIAADRADRFQGKVGEQHARCRGGENAVTFRKTPWVDWSNYWGSGDARSKSERTGSGSNVFDRNKRGLNGALIDLEYQRMELIKFNLFDNSTYQQYLSERTGPVKKVWKELRLPASDPHYRDLSTAADGTQLCKGELIRFRTVSGICNDIKNPAMGSTGQVFARNVEFESTFPDLEQDQYAKNRHGGRISLLQPDPQVISRKLFTRDQSATPNCNKGYGDPEINDADCSYKKAPFFNVLAAFWIQFMTHDWFSHQDDARNNQSNVMTSLGCRTERVGNVDQPLSPERARELGCRPDDKMEAALFADTSEPGKFKYRNSDRLQRAYKTTRNHVTAWWDASQIYGFDDRSRRRVKRDPADPAKLQMMTSRPSGTAGDRYGYLPEFQAPCPDFAPATDCDPIRREWQGQEATAFPDSWSIGLSFYHNLFAREHNIIVDALRELAKKRPNEDSGLRNPSKPGEIITYSRISNDELFEIARLIVAAEIAKIHTIEWTPQLLYNEPLNVGMNSNWSGLFHESPLASAVTAGIVKTLARSSDPFEANQLYSALAAGAGIVGRGSSKPFPPFFPAALTWDRWSLSNPDDVNGGTNHFGSPFNFPEEFVSVYRLHALLPDILQYRELAGGANPIRKRVPVIDTFRAKATRQMHEGGLANWALTMGRQRLGTLSLRNQPQFLQNLDLSPRLDTKIDLAALDVIRDRERGIPRFNEFRRQIGLRQLTSFDDFIDVRLPAGSPEVAEQRGLVNAMREVYGQHRCDASRVITTAQRGLDGRPINDCLGYPDGSMVDNVEDLDLVVGFLAETTRPHGFAISETQFHIFIINASRRLFSDRFLTSSFRPEFYTKLGIDWVMNNGPTGKQWEDGEPNGHKQEISPLKRVLLRAMPELADELKGVANAFDPWARDLGEYYSLAWKPRRGAESDPAFKQ